MTDLVHARVVDHLGRLRLGHVAERLDALLSEAAKKDLTYLDFLDGLLGDELASKTRKRVAMGVQIAHFPAVKTLEDFDFRFQPTIDQNSFGSSRRDASWRTRRTSSSSDRRGSGRPTLP